MAKTKYRFSFGPWNVHSGADPFGPPVRSEFSFAQKMRMYKELGFDGVQFHDDDVVDAKADLKKMTSTAKRVRKMLEDEGLEPEFVAPRLWEDPRTIDGGWTSNKASERKYAYDRSKRAIDIANILGTRRIVLWPAREGTYIREAKDSQAAAGQFVDYMNAMLEYHPNILILGEMKPNEPMDQAYSPTTGHFIGLAYRTVDPDRVGALIETAHVILAGLDPSDEMGYALWHDKLWGVHLTDQNGLKFDEDKSFGAVNLRRAFDQVYVLEKAGYGQNGEFVGLDVKALRTQKKDVSTKHLSNSREIFLALVDVVRSIDESEIQAYRDARDYEGLELFLIKKLLNR